jgi:protein-L-isoaspartate(D-aspartate) O-methyltransferase
MHRCRTNLFRAYSAVMAIALLLSLQGSCSKPKSLEEQRSEMVRTQIKNRGIRDEAILKAFNSVPREEYVIEKYREHAYDDLEAPSGFGQSLNRPFENAIMIRALDLGPGDRVLEVGTGSGYLASLIGKIAKEVYTIEIEPDIAEDARQRLKRLGYGNITVKTGDGFVGWAEHAPFNAIIMAASPNRVPAPLKKQLAEGGRLVLPLGGSEKFQQLVLFIKKDGRMVEKMKLSPTSFVPMKGKILEEK